MARMPSARWLGEHSPRNRMNRYDIVCVHTIVGFAPAHAAHFSVHANGTIVQSRDTAFQSAANLDGNPRVIAVENEDHGPAFGDRAGSAVPPLTDAQVVANARILRWAHATHGIPLHLCPDSRPGSRGLAYHRQGINGNFGPLRFPGRVAGGEVWSEHFGKVCPGDARIAQLPQILAVSKGDDMFEPDDRRMLREVHRMAMGSRERERQMRARGAEAARKLDRLLDEVRDDATRLQLIEVRDEIAAIVAEEEPA